MLSGERVRQIAESPWFSRSDSPYLVVDTHLRIRAANSAYALATGHPRAALVGEMLFDVFPDNPDEPGADGVANLSASFEAVFRHGRRHWMGIQRYDVPDRDRPGRFRYRVWAPVNSPIEQDGRTVGSVHRPEDVTAVFPTDASGSAWPQVKASARRLWGQFPGLPYEAVVGVLAHSQRVVMAVAGRPDPERGRELAALRLELLAGHRRPGRPDPGA